MNGFVYGLSCLCHPESGVRYVGLTRSDPLKRMTQHRHEASSRPRLPVHKWMRKHGVENIEQAVLEVVEVGEVAAREVHWIARLRADGAELLNLTDGGESTNGYVRPQWLRERSRQAQLGQRRGEANPFFGRRHTAEARATMAARRAGERNARAKLTRSDVAAIRASGGSPSISALARQYGVSRPTITRALSGETWASAA